jgi:hypothetical protein
MVRFGLLDALLEFGQQFDGALDLPLHGGAVQWRRFQMLQSSLRDRRDLAQLLVERARLPLLRFAE